MKNVLLAILLTFSTLFVMAQQSWIIKLGNKMILSASKEDEKANNRKISTADWEKNVPLEIVFKETNVDKSLKRSILFFDENDNELIRKGDTCHTKIFTDELRRVFAGKHLIRIFTIAIPRDPEQAARVRVRRVHLCTLELQ